MFKCAILLCWSTYPKVWRTSRENDSVGSDGHLVIADIIAEQGDVGEGLVGKHVLDLVGPFFMEVIPGYHCTS